jgi:hypothetical protein
VFGYSQGGMLGHGSAGAAALIDAPAIVTGWLTVQLSPHSNLSTTDEGLGCNCFVDWLPNCFR